MIRQRQISERVNSGSIDRVTLTEEWRTLYLSMLSSRVRIEDAARQILQLLSSGVVFDMGIYQKMIMEAVDQYAHTPNDDFWERLESDAGSSVWIQDILCQKSHQLINALDTVPDAIKSFMNKKLDESSKKSRPGYRTSYRIRNAILGIAVNELTSFFDVQTTVNQATRNKAKNRNDIPVNICEIVATAAKDVFDEKPSYDVVQKCWSTYKKLDEFGRSSRNDMYFKMIKIMGDEPPALEGILEFIEARNSFFSLCFESFIKLDKFPFSPEVFPWCIGMAPKVKELTTFGQACYAHQLGRISGYCDYYMKALNDLFGLTEQQSFNLFFALLCRGDSTSKWWNQIAVVICAISEDEEHKHLILKL